MKNPAVRYAAAAVLIVAVLGLQFAGVFADDESTRAQSATTPRSTSDVTVDPAAPGITAQGADGTAPAGPVQGAAPEDVVPDFDERVAVYVAVARSTWSWRDREALSWADRLAALSTSGYADQLEELPTTAVDESEWAHGVIAPEAASRVVDVHVKHLDGSAASGTVDLLVRYDVEISYGQPALAHPHTDEGAATEPTPAPEPPAAGEWVPLYPQKVNMRFVVEDGRWLLDALAYPAG